VTREPGRKKIKKLSAKRKKHLTLFEELVGVGAVFWSIEGGLGKISCIFNNEFKF
jgi:hypothetical protein